jgi:hypothetical protein
MVEIELDDGNAVFVDKMDENLTVEALVTQEEKVGIMLYFNDMMIWSEPDIKDTIEEMVMLAKVVFGGCNCEKCSKDNM